MKQWILAALLAVAATASFAQDKAVYHINDANAQALDGLRNIGNHLDVESKAQITVVSHSRGVDFLMEGAKAPNGTEYASLVSGLRSRGVKFEVCEITLKRRNLKKEQFIQEAEFTPSGVARISKLQHEGYSYIKP
jgi:intracellular sulfur oxidation DsrE/DsrF family protein